MILATRPRLTVDEVGRALDLIGRLHEQASEGAGVAACGRRIGLDPVAPGLLLGAVFVGHRFLRRLELDAGVDGREYVSRQLQVLRELRGDPPERHLRLVTW